MRFSWFEIYILFYFVKKKWEFNINRKQKRGEREKKKKRCRRHHRRHKKPYTLVLAAHNIPPAGRRRPFSLVYLLCVCVCVHITVECGWVATRGVGAVKERKRVKEEEATDRPEGDAMRQPPDIY